MQEMKKFTTMRVMKKTFYLLFFSFGFCLLANSSPFFSLESAPPFEMTKNLPIASQGRFRSMDSHARLWLYDLYHSQKIKKKDLKAFEKEEASALDLLWQIHFLGHEKLDHAPLFWIHYAEVKNLLGLPTTKDRFSFSELENSLLKNQESNLSVIHHLLLQEFKRLHLASQDLKTLKLELSNLSPDLWVVLKNNRLSVAKAPDALPWHFLTTGALLSADVETFLSAPRHQGKQVEEEILRLLQAVRSFSQMQKESFRNEKETEYEKTFKKFKSLDLPPKEIVQRLESSFPLPLRLQSAGNTLKMIPTNFANNEWVSLKSLNLKAYHQKTDKVALIDNFSAFSNQAFHDIRQAYQQMETLVLSAELSSHSNISLQKAVAKFTNAMSRGYSELAGKPYQHALGKSILYPTSLMLQAETLYYRLPLIKSAIFAYAIALLLMFLFVKLKKEILKTFALAFLAFGFLLHSSILVLRCYILQRPPVSNMFETVVYVPWIALLLGFAFYFFSRSLLILAAACFSSIALLILLELTHVDSRLENVQAVLDSQYWLIIHVLMVVGSYGAFAVSGILAHFFLIAYCRQKDSNTLQQIAKGLLHTMYVGLALLIPGTILGGVWAAESWGRFWDWDPKESWAFISACVYLLIVHAYTFRYIKDFGLAIGAVAGLDDN